MLSCICNVDVTFELNPGTSSWFLTQCMKHHLQIKYGSKIQTCIIWLHILENPSGGKFWRSPCVKCMYLLKLCDVSQHSAYQNELTMLTYHSQVTHIDIHDHEATLQEYLEYYAGTDELEARQSKSINVEAATPAAAKCTMAFHVFTKYFIAAGCKKMKRRMEHKVSKDISNLFPPSHTVIWPRQFSHIHRNLISKWSVCLSQLLGT